MMKIKIREGLEIGDGCKPFIIAEVGSNWASLDDCLTSIVLAKQCGADAVKFQAFNHKALFGFSHPSMMSEYDNLPMSGTLPLDWLPKLKTHADSAGIEFMCSAFSPELVDAVNPYVNVHKVASAELSHVRMLERLRHHGKPVILSTGASGEYDIRRALEMLKFVPVVLMYCVAAYPAREVQLGQIGIMRGRFGVPIGYSDHSTDVLTIPRAAALAGAVAIEKHVNFVGAQGPDAQHSLTNDEFRRMVGSIRGYGSETWHSAQERPMILRHNRRLIATKEIKEGETFKEGENFGIYRSLKDDTHALSPFEIGHVVGKTARKAIQAGAGIGPGDV